MIPKVWNLESALEYTASQNTTTCSWEVQATGPTHVCRPHLQRKCSSLRKSTLWRPRTEGEDAISNWGHRGSAWEHHASGLSDRELASTKSTLVIQAIQQPELNGICCPFQWSCGSGPTGNGASSIPWAVVVDLNLTWVGRPSRAFNFSVQRDQQLDVCQISGFLSPISRNWLRRGKGEREVRDFTHSWKPLEKQSIPFPWWQLGQFPSVGKQVLSTCTGPGGC